MACPRTCGDAANVAITQELLDRDSSSLWCASIQLAQQLAEKRTIDGKDVALVFVKNVHMDHPVPYLQCACDFHYEERRNSRMHYIDTHSCERKMAWHCERWNEVALEYNDKGLSPKAIILDIFDRVVRNGEFLGQTEGDWVYVQDLGEVFLKLDPRVWGDEAYPLQKDSMLYKRMSASSAHAALSINKNRPLELHWHPEAPTMEGLAYTHALDIVRTLIDEKKLSLNGMVLTPYRAPNISDETRTPMLSWEEKINVNQDTMIPPTLMWMSCLRKRFHAEVQRIDPYTATLCLFRHERRGKPDQLVKTWKVGLSYGAQFGPDVADVYAWQKKLKKFMYAKLKHAAQCVR